MTTSSARKNQEPLPETIRFVFFPANPRPARRAKARSERILPDPADAKIGVCVKGCDSRTLVALLQEELLDKEKLYVVGVPCDGIIDRRKLEAIDHEELEQKIAENIKKQQMSAMDREIPAPISARALKHFLSRS